MDLITAIAETAGSLEHARYVAFWEGALRRFLVAVLVGEAGILAVFVLACYLYIARPIREALAGMNAAASRAVE